MDERKPVSEAREELGHLVDIAHFSGEVTVITKNGEPRAALVPYSWYREAETRQRQTVGQPGAVPGADLDRTALDGTGIETL